MKNQDLAILAWFLHQLELNSGFLLMENILVQISNMIVCFPWSGRSLMGTVNISFLSA